MKLLNFVILIVAFFATSNGFGKDPKPIPIPQQSAEESYNERLKRRAPQEGAVDVIMRAINPDKEQPASVLLDRPQRTDEQEASAKTKSLPRFGDWRDQILDLCPDLMCTEDQFHEVMKKVCPDGKCPDGRLVPVPRYAVVGCENEIILANPQALRGISFWRASVKTQLTNMSSDQYAMIENVGSGSVVQGLCPGGAITLTFSPDWLGKEVRKVDLRARPWDAAANRSTGRMRINGPCIAYSSANRQAHPWDFSFDNVPPDFSGPVFGPQESDTEQTYRRLAQENELSYEAGYPYEGRPVRRGYNNGGVVRGHVVRGNVVRGQAVHLGHSRYGRYYGTRGGGYGSVAFGGSFRYYNYGNRFSNYNYRNPCLTPTF